MPAELNNEKGMVRISNAVISKIAGFEATKCYGVVGMAVRSGKDGIANLLKVENLDKGVKIKVEDGKVDISLFVIMEYGVNISTVGDIIKSNVKYQVEEATGLTVSSVTVNVESIRIN